MGIVAQKAEEGAIADGETADDAASDDDEEEAEAEEDEG